MAAVRNFGDFLRLFDRRGVLGDGGIMAQATRAYSEVCAQIREVVDLTQKECKGKVTITIELKGGLQGNNVVVEPTAKVSVSPPQYPARTALIFLDENGQPHDAPPVIDGAGLTAISGGKIDANDTNGKKPVTK